MNIEINISNVILETDRLILRAWEIRDLDDFFEYASINGVGEKAGWEHHKSKDESLEILKMFINEKKVFAIVLKENQKVIGSIGVEECRQDLDKNLENLLGRELGYVLSKNYWNKGIMTEAVSKVIEYCFKILKLNYLIATPVFGYREFYDCYRPYRAIVYFLSDTYAHTPKHPEKTC